MATGYKLDMDFKLLKDFFKLLYISQKKKKGYPHEVLHSQFSHLDFAFYFYFYWATPVIPICFVC